MSRAVATGACSTTRRPPRPAPVTQHHRHITSHLHSDWRHPRLPTRASRAVIVIPYRVAQPAPPHPVSRLPGTVAARCRPGWLVDGARSPEAAARPAAGLRSPPGLAGESPSEMRFRPVSGFVGSCVPAARDVRVSCRLRRPRYKAAAPADATQDAACGERHHTPIKRQIKRGTRRTRVQLLTIQPAEKSDGCRWSRLRAILLSVCSGVFNSCDSWSVSPSPSPPRILSRRVRCLFL